MIDGFPQWAAATLPYLSSVLPRRQVNASIDTGRNQGGVGEGPKFLFWENPTFIITWVFELLAGEVQLEFWNISYIEGQFQEIGFPSSGLSLVFNKPGCYSVQLETLIF